MELKEEIQGIIKLLYQENTKDAYRELANCIPKIALYISTMEEDRQRELTEVFKEALEMMEQDDLTSLADILQYEFLDRI